MVRKIFYVGLLLLVSLILMTSCSSSTPTPAQPTPYPIPNQEGNTPQTTGASTPTPVESANVTPAPTPTPISIPNQGPYALSEDQDSGIPGVPAGLTKNGDLYRGNPDAPVTFKEFSDYQCPYCGRYVQETAPSIRDEYVKAGKIKQIFKNFPLTSIHPQAKPAAEAALCAGVQGKFWPMHDLLFEHQREWSGKENPQEVFVRLAEQLELDVDKFKECLDAHPFDQRIQLDIQEGVALGVRGTPAFVINGWFISGAQGIDTFRDVIEKALKGEVPTPTPTPSYGDLHPFEADPEHPGHTYMGDAFIGKENATILILEVGDVADPECRTYHQTVWPKFKKQFVDTGRVRVAFKHVLTKENSELAAEAVECAGEQQKFFDYLDVLYEHQEEWTNKKGKDLAKVLKAYAKDVDLDTKRFSECLDYRQMRDKVMKDQQMMARANLQSLPAFYVIAQNQVLGRTAGALTLDQWTELLQQVEDALKQQNPSSSGQ